MNTASLIIALTISIFSFGQDTTSQTVNTAPAPPWKLTALYGVSGTQSSFVNWSAGGRNNISLLGYISSSAKYTKNHLKWDSDLDVSLGGLQYLGKDSGGEGLQKTDDKIEISSIVGYQLGDSSNIYTSLVGGFRTQFLKGYTYPNDSVHVSKFMAPGYFNLALGMDYTPDKHLTLFVSPIAAKWTVVRDQTLANAGAFGVEPATFDNLGNVLVSGQTLRSEFGAYIKMTYDKEIVKNIEMKSSLEFFSNYLKNPQNIDVNGDVLFTFKVNKWFSASLNWTLIYDHDIKIALPSGSFGPRTQFKSVLGVGISYTMKNFVEEEKKK